MKTTTTMWTALVTAVVLVAGVAGVVSPASANASIPGPTDATATPLTGTQLSELRQAKGQWDLVRPAISYDSTGEPHLDGALALELGTNPDTVRQFATGIVAAGGTVSDVTTDAAAVAAAQNTLTKIRSCSGSNDEVLRWFGYDFMIDSCTTHEVIDALATGASAAELLAILGTLLGFGGSYAALVGGVLALGSNMLRYCAEDGTGTVIHVSWSGIPWCTAQD
ncbi:hypothetical protein [Luethyella okanaganae]|uniref:Uncharacterized protein n=1 Tax=Luethyella okanaganae TaxID=69372 RepID=A0ABW1VI13_9MICO